MRVITNELVPVYENEQNEKLVDARELHQFLESKQQYSDWIKNRIEKYGFIEEKDFFISLGKSNGGRPTTEYALKLNIAKELCMVENNEQGSQARKYFIAVEDRFKSQVIDVTRLTPEMQLFNQMFNAMAKMQIDYSETRKQLVDVTTTVATIQETFLQHDEDWRKSINSMLSGVVYRLKGEHQALRNESYDLLEERAHCDLSARLRNLRARLEAEGATKTKIEATRKLDVIETDVRLKEIYSTIVKELSIGSLKIAR